MNKIITFIFIIIIVFAIIAYSKTFNEQALENTPTPTITGFFPTPADAKNVIEVSYNNEEYYVFYSPINNRSIELIPNFTQKIASSDLINNHKCSAAINGGFYTTENTPLGLFIANGKQYTPEIINDRNLLTGFFSVDNNGSPAIGSVKPDTNQLVIQTGPLLLRDIPFNARIDENARRSLIVKDSTDTFYLVMITLKNDIYSGPFLSHLPGILFSISDPFSIEVAINLDGGSASTFYDDDFHIPELSNIGSLICIY